MRVCVRVIVLFFCVRVCVHVRVCHSVAKTAKTKAIAKTEKVKKVKKEKQVKVGRRGDKGGAKSTPKRKRGTGIHPMTFAIRGAVCCCCLCYC